METSARTQQTLRGVWHGQTGTIRPNTAPKLPGDRPRNLGSGKVEQIPESNGTTSAGRFRENRQTHPPRPQMAEHRPAPPVPSGGRLKFHRVGRRIPARQHPSGAHRLPWRGRREAAARRHSATHSTGGVREFRSSDVSRYRGRLEHDQNHACAKMGRRAPSS